MKTAIALHLVARTQVGCRPFHSRESSAALWCAFRRAFPTIHAAVIMPNHLHIITPNIPRARWHLGIAMRSVSRTLGPEIVRWEPAPHPDGIGDEIKLATAIRYVHLNPVRARLVNDPLEWEWSTLREILGARLDRAWLDFSTLAKIHRVTPAALQAKLLSFTANDAFCAPSAARLPIPWSAEMRPSATRIGEAIWVGGSLLKWDVRSRSAWIRACREIGGFTVAQIAAVTGRDCSNVRKALRRPAARDWSNSLQTWRKILAEPRFKIQR